MPVRKICVRPQGATSVDINVTPLIDVVLVLLIIFMVVTPLSEKEIGVQLPEVSKEEPPPDAPPPDDQVVVGITREGQFTINGTPVSDADYIPMLRRIMNARQAGDKTLFFMPHELARYERLCIALSGAREAGAETLGMVTQSR